MFSLLNFFFRILYSGGHISFFRVTVLLLQHHLFNSLGGGSGGEVCGPGNCSVFNAIVSLPQSPGRAVSKVSKVYAACPFSLSEDPLHTLY